MITHASDALLNRAQLQRRYSHPLAGKKIKVCLFEKKVVSKGGESGTYPDANDKQIFKYGYILSTLLYPLIHSYLNYEKYKMKCLTQQQLHGKQNRYISIMQGYESRFHKESKLTDRTYII